MSTAVLCGERPRKLAIKFKLGQPLPVPRGVLRRERKGHEIGITDDGQVGYLVDRPRQGGAYTRALVSAFAKAEAAEKTLQGTMRRHAEQARAQAEDANAEAFAYLEGLAELDALTRDDPREDDFEVQA